MKKKNVYIPIEIYYREFHQRLYLISKAIKKNFRVYIGTKYGIDKILDKKIKDKSYGGIYFYKSNIISNKNYLTKICNACDNFVILDEELGPAVSNPNLSLSIRAVFDQRIKKFFVIGKYWKDKILKHDKNFKNIVSNTGWPKYDLIKDKEFNFYVEKSKKIKKKFGKFYLFSSNFGTLSQNGLIKMKKKQIKNHSKKFWSKRKKIFEQNINDFKEFIKNLNDYYSKDGKKKLIIRPHPSEFNHCDWINNTKSISNKVSVIYEGDIIPWIIASEGLVHRGCGTSIDAILLNKDSFFWKPNRKLKKSEKNITYKISKVIKNFNQIKNFKIKSKNKFNYIKKHVENFRNINSSEKIVQEMIKLKTIKEHAIEPENKLKLMFKGLVRSFKYFIIKNKNQKIPHNIETKNIYNFYKNLKNFDGIKIRAINTEAIEIDSLDDY